ncbi:hypothetical protein [Streptomyces sp. NPDC002520]
MPKTTYPTTPAEVAAAVLDAIERRRDAFRMNEWFYQPQHRALLPSDEPDCGTTMCIAGWAAHVTGWTLYNSLHAIKDGESRLIESVATDALGLDCETNEIFWWPGDDALSRLREIAGR